MDRDTAVAEIRRRLGQRSSSLDTQLTAEMDLVQSTLEMGPVLPWFLVSEDSYVSTTANEERIRVPTGFLREYEQGALWVYDASADLPWKLLKKNSADRLRKSLGGSIDETGEPEFYALAGFYFRLYPVPDAVYTIYCKFYKADTAPTAFNDGADTNLWLTHAPGFFIAETVLTLGQHLQYERDVMKRYEDRAALERDRFFRAQEARVHANMRYEMGT